MSADGVSRRTFANVDHEQHPTVGDDVTVIHSESNPGKAVVVGYESDGVSVGGIGALFTLVFTIPLGVILIIKQFRRRRKQRTA